MLRACDLRSRKQLLRYVGVTLNTIDEPRDLGIAARLTRSRGRTGRDKNANARLTESELNELRTAAKSVGKALGEWNREVLLREARRGCTDRAIFTELMALRLFVNGVLREIALGRTLTEKQFEAHLAEAKKNKHQTAADVLAQYQPSTEGAE